MDLWVKPNFLVNSRAVGRLGVQDTYLVLKTAESAPLNAWLDEWACVGCALAASSADMVPLQQTYHQNISGPLKPLHVAWMSQSVAIFVELNFGCFEVVARSLPTH